MSDPIDPLRPRGQAPNGVAPAPAAVTPAGAAPEQMHFAAFGDSLMWGQGVARDDRFSVLTAQGIGALHSRDGHVAFDDSRSGAQIKVRDGSDREDFVDTYPFFFETPAQEGAFLGGDESRATDLFGEVPASFPTVTWQVRSIEAAKAARIEVALVCGGGNDVDFESMLNAQENSGPFVDRFGGDIREICFQDTLELMGEVRAKMPRAVILLFGYYPPFSYETRLGALEGFAEHEYDSPVKWWLNAKATEFGVPLPGRVNVKKVASEVRVRSVWAQGLATYWLRRAVTVANQDAALHGPGIIFVPCGFHPENSAYTSQPMVAEDYTPPTGDPMQKIREDKIPRLEALPDMRDLLFRVATGNYEGARALRERINGPRSLEVALFNRRPERGRSPAELLAREIHRIQHALIASFVHPNTRGARQYANMAIARYKFYRDTLASLPGLHDTPPLHLPGDPESLEDRLVRFKLRGDGDMRGDVGHEFIDAIRVTVSTDSRSDRDFPADVSLRLSLKQNRQGNGDDEVVLQLNMQYLASINPKDGGSVTVTKFHPEFEPDRTNEFSVDVSGHSKLRRVLLRDVIGMQLAVSDWPGGGNPTWMPETVRVDINGIEVLSRTFRDIKLHPRWVLNLGYPPPAPREGLPGERPPRVLRSTVLREQDMPGD